ncbi:MAG: hypothetical protein AAFY71_24760 [Bacteroidota bacterium]
MFSKVHTVDTFLSCQTEAWQEIIVSAIEESDLNGITSVEDLKLIKEIDCSRKEIEDLSPLRMFPYLEILDISGTQIRDITPLMYLANLKEFHACFCYPFDLDILITLPKLHTLDISYPRARFADLSAIADLDELKEGYFNACGIKSVADFMMLGKLEVLSIPFNPIPSEEVLAYRDLSEECKVIF